MHLEAIQSFALLMLAASALLQGRRIRALSRAWDAVEAEIDGDMLVEDDDA